MVWRGKGTARYLPNGIYIIAGRSSAWGVHGPIFLMLQDRTSTSILLLDFHASLCWNIEPKGNESEVFSNQP